jgi:hypothetical protein
MATTANHPSSARRGGVPQERSSAMAAAWFK